MIIGCPECSVKFLVNAQALGDEGRKVRCGKCQHVWFQKAPEPELVESEKEIIREQQENLRRAAEERARGVQPSLPVVIPKVPVPKWMQPAIFALVIINALTFVAFNKDLVGQTGFYDMLGQYDTKDVIINSATLSEPQPTKDGNMYLVTWSVTNTAKSERPLPTRRIRLMDKDLEVIRKGEDDKEVKLKASQNLAFDPNPVINTRGKGRYIIVEIGNPAELSWR